MNSEKEMNNEFNIDDFQLRNEKQPLSIDGELLAQKKLNIDEFNDLDKVYSSNYVRAISTAKYLLKGNTKLIIDSNLGERKFGIEEEKRDLNFAFNQVLDENLKYPNGESRKEVTERIYSSLINILNQDDNKIAIVFHANAMFFLLMKLCELELTNNGPRFKFNNDIFFSKKIDFCEIFKLEFNDNHELISIKNL
ncbi:MAG: histidine phosphatase family protein [Lactobacillales bacterium]|nr:histidine phosphatase family protein [Lactobacillales bacterium]